MNGFEKALKKILKKHGWSFLRQAKGSHEYWSKCGYNPVTVPHLCKSRHTANAILIEAKIDHKF